MRCPTGLSSCFQPPALTPTIAVAAAASPICAVPRLGTAGHAARCAAQEVADHASSDTCWIVINDSVLDVTEFLMEHPGGEDIIMEHAGAATADGTLLGAPRNAACPNTRHMQQQRQAAPVQSPSV